MKKYYTVNVSKETLEKLNLFKYMRDLSSIDRSINEMFKEIRDLKKLNNQIKKETANF